MSKNSAADSTQATDSAEQEQMFNLDQSQIGEYNTALNKLKAQGNPWANPTYLQNENVLTSGAAGSADSAAKQQIADAVKASGGQNSAAYGATVADLSRNRAQQQTQATAGQYSNDYNNWIQYQQWLQNATLAPTGAEGAAFGTASSGNIGAINAQNTANQIGDQLWGSVIGGVTGGLGSAFAGTGKV